MLSWIRSQGAVPSFSNTVDERVSEKNIGQLPNDHNIFHIEQLPVRAEQEAESTFVPKEKSPSLPKKKRRNRKSKAGKTGEEKRAEALDPRRNRPLNRFNLYYILERERILQSNPDYRPGEADGPLPPEIITGYEGMAVPELPSRYRHIVIAPDW